MSHTYRAEQTNTQGRKLSEKKAKEQRKLARQRRLSRKFKHDVE